MKNILLYTTLLLSLTTLSQNKHTDSVDCVRTINMYKKLEVKLQNNINFQNTNLKAKLIEIDLLNESLVKTKKQLKRQKIYKWIFVINSIGLRYYIIK